MSVGFEEKVLSKLDTIDQRLDSLEKKMDENHEEVMTLCRQMDITIREIQGKDNGTKNRYGVYVRNRNIK